MMNRHDAAAISYPVAVADISDACYPAAIATNFSTADAQSLRKFGFNKLISVCAQLKYSAHVCIPTLNCVDMHASTYLLPCAEASTTTAASADSSSSTGTPVVNGRPNAQLPKNFDPAEREQQLYKW